MEEYFLDIDYWKIFVEWASILSLIISVAVLVQSVSIKNKTNEIIHSMVNKARMPEIFKGLSDVSVTLSKAMSNKDNEGVEECVVEIRSLSSSLKDKLSDKKDSGLDDLILEADSFLHDKKKGFYCNGRQVYLRLRYVIKYVGEHIKDERLK
ncbi:hypothetical protein [Vreelandella titanicae]|uniref:Uncharacterized protein n=1 Tax=Vreelandella titanicae TaxID=664683 RepID=A0AAP9T224_9GAMM|nr:hypothetical protein [Halomonas titanicae]QKS26562.1 hypothetical protein FX987_04371 [Halomonas titanicae]